MNNPKLAFIEGNAEEVLKLQLLATGNDKDVATLAKAKLIEMASQNIREAQIAVASMQQAKQNAEQAAMSDKPAKFRKPRKLTKDVFRRGRTTLNQDAKIVRNINGRQVPIKDLLQKGGLVKSNFVPSYVTQAIAWKMEKAAEKVNPTGINVKSIGPKQPTDKQLQRAAAREQAMQDKVEDGN